MAHSIIISYWSRFNPKTCVIAAPRLFLRAVCRWAAGRPCWLTSRADIEAFFPLIAFVGWWFLAPHLWSERSEWPAWKQLVREQTHFVTRQRDGRDEATAWIMGRLRSSSITTEITYESRGHLRVLVIAASAAAQVADGNTRQQNALLVEPTSISEMQYTAIRVNYSVQGGGDIFYPSSYQSTLELSVPLHFQWVIPKPLFGSFRAKLATKKQLSQRLYIQTTRHVIDLHTCPRAKRNICRPCKHSFPLQPETHAGAFTHSSFKLIKACENQVFVTPSGSLQRRLGPIWHIDGSGMLS